MEQVGRAIFAVAVPLVLLGLTVWMWLVVIPRQRRTWREHPERKPYGRRYLLRVSPMLAVAAVITVAGLLSRNWTTAGIGAFCLAGFSWEVKKRWHRPSRQGH